MSNQGGVTDALFDSFPGDNPRPLLGTVFGFGVVGGLVVTGGLVISAFTVDPKAGFIALFVNGLGLFVWLAMLRVGLEAAGALFDMRDESRVVRDLQVSVAGIRTDLKSIDKGKDGRRPSPPKTGRPDTGRRELPRPDSPEQLVEIVVGEMKDWDDMHLKRICRSWDVSVDELLEALSQLQAEGLVVKTGSETYKYVGDLVGNDEQTDQPIEQATDATRRREPRARAGATDPVAAAIVVPEACSQCGTERKSDQRFCSKCGNRFS